MKRELPISVLKIESCSNGLFLKIDHFILDIGHWIVIRNCVFFYRSEVNGKTILGARLWNQKRDESPFRYWTGECHEVLDEAGHKLCRSLSLILTVVS